MGSEKKSKFTGGKKETVPHKASIISKKKKKFSQTFSAVSAAQNLTFSPDLQSFVLTVWCRRHCRAGLGPERSPELLAGIPASRPSDSADEGTGRGLAGFYRAQNLGTFAIAAEC